MDRERRLVSDLCAVSRAPCAHGRWANRRTLLCSPFRPTRKNGERVTGCCNIDFNAHALDGIVPRMEKHWPSILHKNEDFWRRQWVKYGSCLLELFETPAKFFEQGLEWNEQWPLGQILRKKDVIPSNDKAYSYKQFYDSIREVVGHTPHLKCHTYKVVDLLHLSRLYDFILLTVLLSMSFHRVLPLSKRCGYASRRG